MNSDTVLPDIRSAGCAIPDHVMLGPIASGSYGEVWLARNAVGTLRAVKIVRRDRFERAEDFEREFKGLQNFEPISRSHEGLVDILTLGLLPEGVGFYYVMELADAAGNQGSVTSSQSSAASNQLSVSSNQYPNAHAKPLYSDHRSLITLRVPCAPTWNSCALAAP